MAALKLFLAAAHHLQAKDKQKRACSTGGEEMKDWQVKIWIQAQAIVAEIEGMKSENDLAKICNNTIPYGEDAFFRKSFELQELAREIVNY